MTPRDEERNDRVEEAVSRILDKVELELPPEDLKPNVLRAIGTRPEPARSGWFETLRAEVSRRFAVRLYPFAAGVAVGAITLAILSGGWRRGAGADAVDGVMAPPASGVAGRAPERLRVDDQSFELGRANVRFEVFRSGARAAVSVSADAAEPVVVTLQTGGSSRVERVVAVPSAAGSAEYGPTWVRLWQSGRDRAEVGLDLAPGFADTPISITVQSRGQSVQGALRTAKPA